MEILGPLKLKRGDARPDGKVFLAYVFKNGKRRERWITPSKLKEVRLRRNQRYKSNSKIANTTETRARAKLQRQNKYKMSSEFRAYCREQSRVRRKTFPEKYRAYRSLRRARERMQTHIQADLKKITVIYQSAAKESAITGVPYEVDHIIPISGGGFHHEENLQVIPKSLNREKRGNLLWRNPKYKDWMCVPLFLWPKGWAMHVLKK